MPDGDDYVFAPFLAPDVPEAPLDTEHTERRNQLLDWLWMRARLVAGRPTWRPLPIA